MHPWIAKYKEKKHRLDWGYSDSENEESLLGEGQSEADKSESTKVETQHQISVQNISANLDPINLPDYLLKTHSKEPYHIPMKQASDLSIRKKKSCPEYRLKCKPTMLINDQQYLQLPQHKSSPRNLDSNITQFQNLQKRKTQAHVIEKFNNAQICIEHDIKLPDINAAPNYSSDSPYKKEKLLLNAQEILEKQLPQHMGNFRSTMQAFKSTS